MIAARALVAVLLASLVAPVAWSHGGHPTEVTNLVVRYAPMDAQDGLVYRTVVTFDVTNLLTVDVPNVRAIISPGLGSAFSYTQSLPDIAAGDTVQVEVVVPHFTTPRTCVLIQVKYGPSDQVCAPASGIVLP